MARRCSVAGAAMAAVFLVLLATAEAQVQGVIPMPLGPEEPITPQAEVQVGPVPQPLGGAPSAPLGGGGGDDGERRKLAQALPPPVMFH